MGTRDIEWRVLGIAQDGGVPQAGCRGACCRRALQHPRLRRRAACAAIVDRKSCARWMIDATPDFREQLAHLDRVFPVPRSPGLAGIFLTHAHAGHYAGLWHLGREALGARGVPLLAMPRMRSFLRRQAPWELLVRLGHVRLRALRADAPVALGPGLAVTPVAVPHRGEYSETVAFRVEGPRRSVLWLPDIDSWGAWNRSLEEVVRGVDAAYLDGTFFADGELGGRDMREVPHPRITETMERLAALPRLDRRRVRFLHLNHTNPALRDGRERRKILRAGFRLAEEGERMAL